MTEKEKMQKQLLYDANYDNDLLVERTKAKELCYRYNQLHPADQEGQQEILCQLLGKTGEHCCITAPFWCDYGYNIELGENFYANHNLVILDGGKVIFGDNVFIAPNCGFHTAGHPIDFERRNQGLEYAYPITVGNNVLRYKFEIRRNITIIKGDSATGKTTLVDMIREYYENGEQSGVTLQCDKQCAVLEGKQWKILLENIRDSIVFIDEGNAFVTSSDFADAVRSSDNYYVIVTRESLPTLPYSVNEIYGIRASGKYGTLQQTYQELYHIYGKQEYNNSFNPDVVIVEDSNSGYEFFEYVTEGKVSKIISANGKSNIFRELGIIREAKVLVIADGAAFGPEMDRVIKRISLRDDRLLYLPESFEWLVLKSGIVKDGEIRKILEEPSKYIDSKEYMSWERFFTALLIEKTKNSYLKYEKTKLNEAYRNEKVAEKIIEVIPDGLLKK